jgi:hypothetical protein
MNTSYLRTARELFHLNVQRTLLTVNHSGVPGNADKDNKTSVVIAQEIAKRLQAATGERMGAQQAGTKFEELVAAFLQDSFLKFSHLRPGKWEVRQVGNRNRKEISRYAQYSHLVELQHVADTNKELAAVLGNDYTITPDVLITRGRESDSDINQTSYLVDPHTGKRGDIRDTLEDNPILHASISTKWTLRSDRAQNARSEALNLIRNRKGRQPHIVVVTGEPLPSRLSSLALGTGDIDCVYHFALEELQDAVKQLNNSEAENLLDIMVSGRRLKDIADLPLDLAV